MTFKCHPLQPPAVHREVMLTRGVDGYHQWLRGKRGTGRSTALALHYLAQAISSPGQPVHTTDHFGTHEADAMLRSTVLGMAESLGLQHIHAHSDDYVVFEDRTTKE